MGSAQDQSALSDVKQTVALLTQHQKGPLIAPALLSAGFTLAVTEAFDTDQLGTFSGEVPRELTPLACAKRKAELAVALTGARYGLGSEGSFGGGPVPGLVSWNEEILLLHDSVTQRDIVAVVSGPVPLLPWQFADAETFEQLWAQCSSGQGWMLQRQQRWYKGLTTAAQVKAILSDTAWLPGEVINLQPDLRAMHCPARQQHIIAAATQLAARLTSVCPQCSATNFWRKDVERGLPCLQCSLPTNQIQAYISSCDCCGHQTKEMVEVSGAEPTWCAFCNP